jgi:hypothetical protein
MGGVREQDVHVAAPTAMTGAPRREPRSVAAQDGDSTSERTPVSRRERVAKRLSAQWAARCGCPGDRAFGVRDRRRAPIELQLASLNTRNPKRNRPSCRVAVYRPRKRKTDQSGKQPVQQVRPSLKRPYPTTESRSTERDGPEEVRQHPGGEQSSHALTTDRRWLTRRAHRLLWQTGQCTPKVHSQSVGSSLIRRRSRRR